MKHRVRIAKVWLLAGLTIAAGCSQGDAERSELERGQPSPSAPAVGVSDGQARPEAGGGLVDEPLLYTQIDDVAGTVTVTANTEVNRHSVEEEVASSWWVTAPSGASKVDYDIEFRTDKAFVVRITGLEVVESVYFNLNGVMSEAGQSFAQDNASRNEVIVTGKQQLQRLKWLDGKGELVRELPLSSALMIQSVDTDSQAGNEALAVYSHGSQRLVQAESGEAADSGLVNWAGTVEPYGNDYGSAILYADRWSGDVVYGIYGNREVFSANRATGELNKHYVSEKPIYGIASSPDGGRFAILVPSDEFVGPEADLIVFDRSGKEQWRKNKAAFSGHSEGFVFPYAMSWPEENTIVVPTEIEGDDRSYRGKAFVSLIGDKVIKQRNEALPEDVFNSFSKEIGEQDRDSLRHVLRGSRATNSEGKFVVQGSSASSWLIDTKAGEVIWLGTGMPLQWNAKGELLMWSGSSEQGIQPVGFE